MRGRPADIAAIFAVALSFAGVAQADDCPTDLSNEAFATIMQDYWRSDTHAIPTGRFALAPGRQLVEIEPDQRPVNPWLLSAMAGAVGAGWATASIDGANVERAGAGAAFANAVEDQARHAITFDLTDMGREISVKAGAPTDGSALYPKLGTAGNFAVESSDLVGVGERQFRVIAARYDLLDRAPNIEAYGAAQIAVAAALSGALVTASPTTPSDGKHGRFLLLLLRNECKWRPLSADIADTGKNFTTNRVDHILNCLRADPGATLKSCDSRN